MPSYSLNCPKCYRQIPREEEKVEEDIRGNYRINDDMAPSVQVYNRKVVMALALIPSIFGFMGFGQFYEREYKKGAMFLIVGLALFWSMVGLISSFNSFGAGGNFLALGLLIGAAILFVATYVAQAFDALVRSIFPKSFKL